MPLTVVPVNVSSSSIAAITHPAEAKKKFLLNRNNLSFRFAS
jgi:hypothetical protein